MEQKYEITYIIKPNLDAKDKDALVKRFDKILTDNGAKVADSSDWQKRRLAYEIDGFKEGLYHIDNVIEEADDKAIDEFDRLAKFDDNILRHMIVKRDQFGSTIKDEKAAKPARKATKPAEDSHETK